MSAPEPDVAEDAVNELWQREHVAHPRMAKETFVRNCLFNGKVSPADLGSWVLQQDDLGDQVWEGGSDSYMSMIEVPKDDGRTWYRGDPNGERVIVRIQMETLHSGESQLLRRETPSWDDYCDD